MPKAILIILTLAGFASGAEMEVADRLSVDGGAAFKSSITVNGAICMSTSCITSWSQASPWAASGSSLSFNGSVAVGTGTPSSKFEVYAATGDVASLSGTPVSDGKTWAQATSAPGWTARNALLSLIYDGKMWVLGGWDGNNKNDIWYSLDGAVWTQATGSAAWTARYYYTATVYNGKMWIMGGNDGSRKNDVWYSSDGAGWTQATGSAGWSARHELAASVYDGKMWVIGGHDGSFKNDVWYSTDGATWTQATESAAWPARTGQTFVVNDGKMWVMGGQTAAGYANDVWYSTDGTAWTQATGSAGWSARCMHTSVVYDSKMWVIEGVESVFKNDVWYSTDGTAWTQATGSAGWFPRGYGAATVYNNKMWILGGWDGAAKNDVWYSTLPQSVFKMTSSGNVGIGTTSPNDKLTVSGGAISMGAVTNSPAQTAGYGKIYYKQGAGVDSYTKLLLHWDGADGSTVFADSSYSNKTATSNNGAHIAAAQFKFGSSSLYVDGIDDYVSVTPDADFDFGTGDFTLDWWCYDTDSGGNTRTMGIAQRDGNNGYYDYYYSGAYRFMKYYGGDNQVLGYTTDKIINSWTHFAIVRHGSTLYMFVNGILGDSNTISSQTIFGNATNSVIIGANKYGGNIYDRLTGYIDELRISKGIARWTTNFSIPSAPYKGGGLMFMGEDGTEHAIVLQ